VPGADSGAASVSAPTENVGDAVLNLTNNRSTFFGESPGGGGGSDAIRSGQQGSGGGSDTIRSGQYGSGGGSDAIRSGEVEHAGGHSTNARFKREQL
jgi:hypothetical protein